MAAAVLRLIRWGPQPLQSSQCVTQLGKPGGTPPLTAAQENSTATVHNLKQSAQNLPDSSHQSSEDKQS